MIVRSITPLWIGRIIKYIEVGFELILCVSDQGTGIIMTSECEVVAEIPLESQQFGDGKFRLYFHLTGNL